MRTRSIKAMILLLIICLFATVTPTMAAEPAVLASGTCGDSLTWVLTDDGVLTISGTGEMPNFASVSNPAPWDSQKDKITSLVVEKGVTSIGSNAFYHHDRLTSVVIESGVTKIGAGAFFYCKKLEYVELPDSVTVIGVSAFHDCESIRSIRLPDGLKRIADSTFEGCKSLRVVVIPKKVYEIAGGAFSRCEELWHILFKGTEKQWKKVTVATHRGDSSAMVKNATKHFQCTGDEVTDIENKICSICDVCSHIWDSGEIIKAATCAEEGEKLLTCTKCEETKTELLSKTNDHSFGDWGREDASYHKRSCAVCGEEDSRYHTWDEGVVTKEATCMAKGEETYRCTDCTAFTTETIAATGHSFSDWTQVKLPTTEETGMEERICGSCGDKQQRELAKLEPPPTKPAQTTPTEPAESTKPTEPQPIEPIEKQPDDSSTVLLVVIGVVGALVISGAVWLIVRKQKQT